MLNHDCLCHEGLLHCYFRHFPPRAGAGRLRVTCPPWMWELFLELKGFLYGFLSPVIIIVGMWLPLKVNYISIMFLPLDRFKVGKQIAGVSKNTFPNMSFCPLCPQRILQTLLKLIPVHVGEVGKIAIAYTFSSERVSDHRIWPLCTYLPAAPTPYCVICIYEPFCPSVLCLMLVFCGILFLKN